MKLINLIAGQKRNLLSNLNSILNCQNEKLKNFNFFVFWESDSLNNKEISIIKKKIKNSYFVTIKNNSYRKKIIKLLKNKICTKNVKEQIIRAYLQYSILQYGYKYACKSLKKNYKNSYWQRIRPDNYIEKKIPTLKKKNILLLPGTIHGYGIIDYHCLGSFSVFKIYANLIDTLTDLYKLNIFVPPEIALRMHLTKYKTNAILTEKLPAALLENSNNISLRVNYARTRGNKYLGNHFSQNIIEKDFKFKNFYLFRKIYYYCYDILIRIKIKFS